jgi:ABC-type multidrug transport system ATPase subunit
MHHSKFETTCLVIFKKYDKCDTGEMLVGSARALFMDEISTGLDSSTTFQIVNSLGQAIHILGGTTLISLLQPAPETYDLFDDIILLSDGQIVYQGPRESVLEFFEFVGFKCPERKGVADFLQEVPLPSELIFFFLTCFSTAVVHFTYFESFAIW